MSTPIIEADELKDRLNDPDLVILDCSVKSNAAGIKSENNEKKIGFSRFFDLKTNFSDPDSGFPNTLPKPSQFENECRKLGINNSTEIVLYDDLGIYTSPRVWWMFKIMGHTKVSVLNGGLSKWIEKSHPVQDFYKADFEAGNFRSNFQPDLIATFQEIEENIKTQDSVVIDARSSGRFNGTETEPRKNLRNGNIPNSVNIPFKKILNGESFKSKEELKLVFKDLKPEKRKLIFSCGSGVTACILYLASELVLDNPKAVYDGSWTEYATLNEG